MEQHQNVLEGYTPLSEHPGFIDAFHGGAVEKLKTLFLRSKSESEDLPTWEDRLQNEPENIKAFAFPQSSFHFSNDYALVYVQPDEEEGLTFKRLQDGNVDVLSREEREELITQGITNYLQFCVQKMSLATQQYLNEEFVGSATKADYYKSEAFLSREKRKRIQNGDYKWGSNRPMGKLF